jgi:hypothetical protein
VFDDPQAAKQAHQRGLRRLFKIALRDQVKFLEKNLHDLTKLGMLYLTLGTQEQLRDQLIDCAIERACLSEPWPLDAQTFEVRRLEGKAKLGLLAQDVARTAGVILDAWVTAVRKLPQAKNNVTAHQDMQTQLAQLVSVDFIARTPVAQLAQIPRYLKAVTARIDKLRTDPARDAAIAHGLKPPAKGALAPVCTFETAADLAGYRAIERAPLRARLGGEVVLTAPPPVFGGMAMGQILGILQAQGAEVIHLGHNRSVDEVVTAALQEDVQGIAMSSYQGGHVEFFKYMLDLLRERGGADIKVFGGG